MIVTSTNFELYWYIFLYIAARTLAYNALQEVDLDPLTVSLKAGPAQFISKMPAGVLIRAAIY